MNSDTSCKVTYSEAKILKELSSFDFGFIKFNTQKGQIKKQILEKTLNNLDNKLSEIVQSIKEKKEEEERTIKENNLFNSQKESDLYEKYSKILAEKADSFIYLYLGHYQLLLYLYEDALSAYLEFESRNSDSWKNIPFLYGLAICYFHFNAFDKAIELFQTILYLQPSCVRSKEIHIRLGYIYKINVNFECSLRHFRQSLNDTEKGSFTETEIRFQIAHLLEVCGKYKQAQKAYEQLISYSKEDVPDHIKHLCYRQLGWLHFCGHIGSSKTNSVSGNSVASQRKDSVISLLHQAITLDDSSGKTWYLYGRAQAKENKVQEAFMAYRNSIDKTEANADTWCSIGVLYQEQNQPMDALQAYFCACQLNRKHVSAWTNLGVLYESMNQHKEALKCYQNAVSADKNNEIRVEIKDRMMILQKLLSLPDNGGKQGSQHQNQTSQNQQSQLTPSSPMFTIANPSQKMQGGAGGQMRTTPSTPQGIISPNTMIPHHQQKHSPIISPQSAAGTNPQAPGGMVMKLPTVDEAWNLPIPTELTQRQMQLEIQEAVAMASSTSGSSAGRLFAHQIPPYLSTTPTTIAGGLPSTTTSLPTSTDSGAMENYSTKRRKIEDVDTIVTINGQQQDTLLMESQQSNQQPKNCSTTSDSDIKKSYEQIISPQNSGNLQNNQNQSNHFNVPNSSTASHEELTLIDGMSDVCDQEIMVNIDALLNDEHFTDDPTTTTTSSNNNLGANPNSNSSQTKRELQETILASQPVTDLLNYLRSIDSEDDQLLHKHLFYNPIDEFNIRMTGSQIIDRATRLRYSDNHNSVYQWSITYLPGNRIPKPPHPPPLLIQQNNNSTNNNNVNNNSTSAVTPTNTNSNNTSLSRQNSEYFQLLPPTPSIYLDCKKDIHSPELRQFCLSQPLVVIRNLASTLRMDLGVFSTKALVDSNPNHKIEQRIQDLQPPDENKDATGKTILRCYSSKNTTTILEYANYQARMFVEAKKDEKCNVLGSSNILTCATSNQNFDESKSNANGSDDKKKRKKIYFGTNCDLSDESKWFTQLHELNKLPSFLKVVSACNMLSHCGFTIQGMNSVQLYMKVPGCRTPGHQENNNFCSVNINVGPGDCEWFCVPEQYWGAINALCEENKIDYLSGSWWPSLDDLKQRHIPCYRFIQRPGDLVWINSGTVHWVQAIGWCNNIAWNVGPLVSRQYSLAMERYEYNKLKMFNSIVPMVHLSWKLAQNIKMTDSHLYQLIKYTLMVSLVHCCLVWNYLEKARIHTVHQAKEENEPTQNCVDCECEVFNIFLIKQIKPHHSSVNSGSGSGNATGNKKGSSTKDVKYDTRCLNCALKISRTLASFKAIYQYKLSELIEIYDSFRFQSTPIAAYSVNR